MYYTGPAEGGYNAWNSRRRQEKKSRRRRLILTRYFGFGRQIFDFNGNTPTIWTSSAGPGCIYCHIFPTNISPNRKMKEIFKVVGGLVNFAGPFWWKRWIFLQILVVYISENRLIFVGPSINLILTTQARTLKSLLFELFEQSKHLTIGRYWAIIKGYSGYKKPYHHGQALDLRRLYYRKVHVNMFRAVSLQYQVYPPNANKS